MRGFGFLWLIGGLLIALIAGGIGYSLGVGANVAAAGAPVVYPIYGWHFGFPFFGLFFGLLFLFLIFGVVRRITWGRHAYGPGGYGMHGYRMRGPGQGGWPQDKPMPPFADEMLQRWHRQAHGETPPTPPLDADKPAG